MDPFVHNGKITTVGVLSCLLMCAGTMAASSMEQAHSERRQTLTDDWLLQSSVLVKEDGRQVSSVAYRPQQWHKTVVPATVLSTLVKNGVYPDPRIGLNSFQIPDSSDEFNAEHDLAKFSHLPDQRNPWRDPYWYRTEFEIPESLEGKYLWLNFDGINYRADVWVNGSKVADGKQMVGIYRSFRFNVTQFITSGKNCLAVLVHPVDHPGKPDLQLTPFGSYRQHSGKEIQKDVTYVMSVGYDCMPPIPDRNMGIWQDVYLETTGPVDIRDPFVATDLPLPKTSPASLTVSVDLVNISNAPQKGILRGVLVEAGVEIAKNIELAPGETRQVVLSPDEFTGLNLANPRLWWPQHYGEQHLYNLRLSFESAQQVSDAQTVTFGIREITRELHKVGDHHGLRVLINGQKIFSQGGWLQPELLFDMPDDRMEAEVRYLTHANLNTVTFEDVPAPNDAFLEACDRHGLMYWMSFFSSYWIQPETNYPLDHALLNQCTVDLIKRYRNHPSLVLYSCVGEGVPSEDIYRTWRKTVLSLDRTRLFVPTEDVRFMVDWLKEDVPTGLHDAVSFEWISPADYYRKVRAGGKWMFNTEVSIATYPPVSSLKKFIPKLVTDCKEKPAPLPVDETWAHHDASEWMQDYDPAIRRLYGEPKDLEDYCMKAALVSAAQHRAWSEAANHRMWTITSGLWQWKLNSCWPSVGWQIYDWYLRPLASAYYYRTAYEPLHVQLSPLDSMVTVINRRPNAERGMTVHVAVYDSYSKRCWEKDATVDAAADNYTDVFTVPLIDGLTPVYFVDLKLRNAAGDIVSRNFYWLSSKEPADFRSLADLPPVKVTTSHEIESSGDESVVRVRIANPTDRIAFFIHLALVRSVDGEEILPVFWDDNYFSLTPYETRVISARVATKNLDGQPIHLQAEGWNIKKKKE